MPAIIAPWAARATNDAVLAVGAAGGEGCVLTLQNAPGAEMGRAM